MTILSHRRRPLALALIAAFGVMGAVLAPALTCAAGTTCSMQVAAPHCAVTGTSEGCGGATLNAGPPLCCTSEASGPSATLRDGTAARSDRAAALAVDAVATTGEDLAAAVSSPQTAQAPSTPTRTRLSLHSTLLL